MSWDQYLPNLKANMNPPPMCWLGGKDGAMWASTDEPEIKALTQPQAKAIADAIVKHMASPDSPSVFQTTGIIVGSTKFMFLRMDGKLAIGKKKDQGFVTAAVTNSALIICIGREGTQHGDLNKNVTSIAEYLESVNM